MPEAGQTTDCWFDEPAQGDRRSWAIPLGHGTYQGLDLELLDPADEDELTFLIEAQHAEFDRSGPELPGNGRCDRIGVAPGHEGVGECRS